MIKPGIYYLYRRYPREDLGEDLRLVGKIYLTATKVKILEDHDDVLGSVFPDDNLSASGLRAIALWSASPYWKLESEEQHEEGEEEIEEYPDGDENVG